LKINDLSGQNYIEQGKMYLTKVINLNVDSLNVIWSKFKLIQAVRNCIAHENSNFKKIDAQYKEQKLYKTIIDIQKQKLGSFHVFDTCDFQIENTDLLINFCDLQEEYFKMLIDIFDEKYFQKESTI
jgi:hypothetical protein